MCWDAMVNVSSQFIRRYVCCHCDAFVDELDPKMRPGPNPQHRYCLSKLKFN